MLRIDSLLENIDVLSETFSNDLVTRKGLLHVFISLLVIITGIKAVGYKIRSCGFSNTSKEWFMSNAPPRQEGTSRGAGRSLIALSGNNSCFAWLRSTLIARRPGKFA